MEDTLKRKDSHMKPGTIQKLHFITIEKLLEMKTNEVPFRLVDVLPSQSYKEGHIPDAVSIPSEEIAQEAEAMLNKTDTIVTYCAGYTCAASTVAAAKLIDLGYKRVLDFKAGKKAWKEAGFDLET